MYGQYDSGRPGAHDDVLVSDGEVREWRRIAEALSDPWACQGCGCEAASHGRPLLRTRCSAPGCNCAYYRAPLPRWLTRLFRRPR